MNSRSIWTVRVPKYVAKAITRFPKEDEDRIRSALRGFEFDPWFGDVEKIKGEEGQWRRRIGSYRIIFLLNAPAKIVSILDIRRRTSGTY